MKKIAFIISLILLVIIPTISAIKYFMAEMGCQTPQKFGVKLVKAYQRDPSSFTQGFFVHNSLIYESFGQFGASGIKSYKLGELSSSLRHKNLSNEFAEGAAIFNDEIVQITWKKGIAYRYDSNLKPVGEFAYNGEGWGISTLDDEFVMSDGSYEIQFRSSDNFKLLRKIEVKEIEQGIETKIDQLNELEVIDGEIWANIWQTDNIVAINPDNGCVEKRIDASSLWDHENPARKYIGGVLNGIAYNKELGHIYLTGKYWNHIFHVELEKR